MNAQPEYELTVVMPCLNEADTLETCLTKAWSAMKSHGIQGEIVVADNGSDDGSIEIARHHGARVVHVDRRGYGYALQDGIDAAKGRYILMGDADDSYDFLEIPKFVDKLRQGHQLVQGCRLPSGGGTVAAGAMPFLHRWWGNPMFTWMVRTMFWAPIHDVYCGMRGFTRAFYERNRPVAGGMEFATEMIIRASLRGEDIAEVPITLHPDGRKAHAPHLRTFRDGWRTLRFFMLRSPRYLFFRPGAMIAMVGAVLMTLGWFNAKVGPMTLDLHTMLVGALAVLLGVQAMQFGIFAKLVAIAEGFAPNDARLTRTLQLVSLERGLMLGVALSGLGMTLIGTMAWRWGVGGFESLSYASGMRWVIPGVVLTAIGFQTCFGRFFAGALELNAERQLARQRAEALANPARSTITPAAQPALETVHDAERCCNETWEEAYARFESPAQEIAKFTGRLRSFGVHTWSRQMRIADVFCGRGNGLVALEQMGFKNLVGVDLSAELLAQYRGSASTYVCDARELVLDDASVDAVVIQGGLHHLPSWPDDLERAIAETARVLKPGGEFLLIEPWDTPFLRWVHRASSQPMLRRLWGKLDAFEVMYENERTTYDRWLAGPSDVLAILDQHFEARTKIMTYGKLRYRAHPRVKQTQAKPVQTEAQRLVA